MPIITLPLDQVVQRGNSLRSMLKCVSRHKEGPAWKRQNTSEQGLVIGFFDTEPFDTDYNEWRFKTRCPDLLALFYERWQQDRESAGDLWYLDRVYFHLYTVNHQEGPSEYIALHCEPNNPEMDTIYKRSPHLHFKASPDPLPKSVLKKLPEGEIC